MSNPLPSLGFAPIARKDAKTLILGSLPSVRSLETGEYFAHPRNAFWRIMGELLGTGPDKSYAMRTAQMVAAGLAVWDVLHCAVRPGSLDANIDGETAKPNDFVKFLQEHPEVRLVCFNGQKAAALFERLVMDKLVDQASALTFLILPSTSPAHASVAFEEKLRRWGIVLTNRGVE